MNRIEHETKLLFDLAATGELPGYPSTADGSSFYADFPLTAPLTADLTEYSSMENDVLERQLKALWAHNSRMQACIPLILAAVEKSRGQDSHTLPPAELYNYTM